MVKLGANHFAKCNHADKFAPVSILLRQWVPDQEQSCAGQLPMKVSQLPMSAINTPSTSWGSSYSSYGSEASGEEDNVPGPAPPPGLGLRPPPGWAPSHHSAPPADGRDPALVSSVARLAEENAQLRIQAENMRLANDGRTAIARLAEENAQLRIQAENMRLANENVMLRRQCQEATAAANASSTHVAQVGWHMGWTPSGWGNPYFPVPPVETPLETPKSPVSTKKRAPRVRRGQGVGKGN